MCMHLSCNCAASCLKCLGLKWCSHKGSFCQSTVAEQKNDTNKSCVDARSTYVPAKLLQAWCSDGRQVPTSKDMTHTFIFRHHTCTCMYNMQTCHLAVCGTHLTCVCFTGHSVDDTLHLIDSLHLLQQTWQSVTYTCVHNMCVKVLLRWEVIHVGPTDC